MFKVWFQKFYETGIRNWSENEKKAFTFSFFLLPCKELQNGLFHVHFLSLVGRCLFIFHWTWCSPKLSLYSKSILSNRIVICSMSSLLHAFLLIIIMEYSKFSALCLLTLTVSFVLQSGILIFSSTTVSKVHHDATLAERRSVQLSVPHVSEHNCR